MMRACSYGFKCAIFLFLTTISCGFVYGLENAWLVRIQELARSNPHQMSFEEYVYIAEKVVQKAPCNFLAFGVGNDSLLWIELNRGGKTVFLEDSSSWLSFVRRKIPSIQAYLVHYDTQRAQWKELLKNRKLLKMDVPKDVLNNMWDIILVDAPAGSKDFKPGRMKSIYMASIQANKSSETDVFVHDTQRKVEKIYCDIFLKSKNLVTTIKPRGKKPPQNLGQLNHYHIVR